MNTSHCVLSASRTRRPTDYRNTYRGFDWGYEPEEGLEDFYGLATSPVGADLAEGERTHLGRGLARCVEIFAAPTLLERSSEDYVCAVGVECVGRS